MDLSPGQQKAVFVLVVVVLAALGYWLILPKVSHTHGQTSPSPSAAAPASAPTQVSQAAPPPTVTASPAATGGVDIYSWLPFTQQGLDATPGVAKVRTDQKQVSTGTAVINSLRAFGPSSLTFVVTGTQHLVTARGTSNGSEQYAITVTGSGGSWQVNDIQLSSVGQS